MSVAEKITSIETHIGNAYQGLANLGADLTNVDKNIDNIASQLDTIYSNLPKVTGTGTNISLTPTYKGKLESTVKGNTEQEGTPTPESPSPIKVVTGDNTITISNADNTHSTSYPISLGSLELCKIGTYQDYIYKDSGKWYKYGAIGKVVLNGSESENWQQNNSQTLTNTYYFSSNKIDGILKSGEKNGFSNYFNVVNELWNTDVQGLQFSTSNSNIRIRIDKTIISDTASLKLWLGTHNTILYYILNTSTSTEITDDGLIGQLNNLEKAMSENGTTNISSTYESGNSQMIITASSLKGN